MAYTWFKQAFLYRVTWPSAWDHAYLEDKLQSQRLKDCSKTQAFSAGWVSPFGEDSAVFSHGAFNRFLMCYAREERVLPPAVVQEAVDTRVKMIEVRDNRAVYAKERRRLKDEVTFDLLPKAFTAKKHHSLYVDPKARWLVLDVATKTRADDISQYLVETLPGLSLALPDTDRHLSDLMTEWLLQGRVPEGFALGADCVMRSPDLEQNTIRFTAQDLLASSVLAHLKNGKKVQRLKLVWQDKLEFSLHADLRISGIKATDILKEQQAEWEQADEAQRVDADFALMSMEFEYWLNALFQSIGEKGVARESKKEENELTA